MRVSNLVSDNELIGYLDRCGVMDRSYRDFVLRSNSDEYIFTLCTTSGFDYAVSHFFDKSEKKGYGLIATNEALRTGLGHQLAIGLIEGDDVVCLDPKTGRISIWMIQTGNGEQLVVAESFDDFIQFCCEKKEQSNGR